MANILEDEESMRLFLERCDSGDPLKDWYDYEYDIASALACLIREKLGDEPEEEE